MAFVAGSAGLAAAAGMHGRPPPRDLHPFIELHVPRAGAPIAIDAETEGKTVWEPEAGGTGIFKDASGNGIVPFTEAKARWTPDTLYFLLYAGDLDLEGTVTEKDGPVSRDDSFHVELGHEGRVYTIDVSVLGTVADADCAGEVGGAQSARRCDTSWDSHAKVAVDRDGTLNQLGDNDEEWVVEMAVPVASLGVRSLREGDRIPFAIRRCEIGKRGVGACGGFGTGKVHGEIVLEREVAGAAHVASARVAGDTAAR
jgi:hypothetical protein